MKGRPTQIKAQFAQTISGQFVQTVPPFPLKQAENRQKEFAQTVCANCFFILGGWFFGVGRLPLTKVIKSFSQGGPGTEPEPETGTIGTVFAGTERGTGNRNRRNPKPEPSSL